MYMQIALAGRFNQWRKIGRFKILSIQNFVDKIIYMAVLSPTHPFPPPLSPTPFLPFPLPPVQ